MLAQYVRNFATKRTIPYVTKGNWKLPSIGSPAPAIEAPQAPNRDEWGTVNSTTPLINVPKEWRRIKTLPQWKKQMFALKEKFPMGWNPLKKLSREQMDHMRDIKRAQPQINLNELASMFSISPEAARRIIKSKWRPDAAKSQKIEQRWKRRGQQLKASRREQASRGQQNDDLRVPKRKFFKVDQDIF